jgi:hypothetical protein
MISTRLPRLYYRTLLIRGAALWLFSRIIAKAMFAQAAAFNPAWAEGPNSMLPVWIVVIAGILAVVDLRRRKELVLLNNLGVETSVAIAMSTLPALLLESLLLLLP